MVCKAAWIPSRGTVLVGESNEPFNPNEGDLSFTTDSPAEQSSADANRKKGDAPLKSATRGSSSEILQEHGAPFETLLNIASLCNVAKVFQDEEEWAARGDPTECAIQVFAHRFQWGRESLTTGADPKWRKSHLQTWYTMNITMDSCHTPVKAPMSRWTRLDSD